MPCSLAVPESSFATYNLCVLTIRLTVVPYRVFLCPLTAIALAGVLSGSPHDPLQCRTHTPARHAPPSQATSACQRISAADRAGRPPQRVVVVVLLIAVRLGSGLAGGGGGRRGEGLAAVAEPDAEPTYLCRRRRWRCAGGSAAALDAAHTATRREHVMRILVHVHTCTTSLFVHTTHSLFTITITPTTRTYVDDRLAQYICICHS
jgi:hypothetical protein